MIKLFLKKHWKQIGILILLVIIAYANSVNNAFVSDDVRAIPQNPNLTNPAFIFANPLSSMRLVLYFLAFKIGGLNPLWYRMINIIFHTGTVLVVYALFTYLSTIHNKLIKKAIAFPVAAVFAVHPLFVESVTWISGGSYSQNGFFILLTFLLYLLSKKRNAYYVASLISYVFILGSPAAAITLPVIILLYEFTFGNLLKNGRRFVPFFIILMLLSLSYFFQLQQRITVIGAINSHQSNNVSPLIKPPVAVLSYLQLIFWPNKLTFYHTERIGSLLELIVKMGSFIFFLSIVTACFKKSKMIFFWLSFFIISLLPTLVPLGVAWIVAERYAYLGAFGIIAATFIIFQKFFESSKSKKVTLIVFWIIIGLFISRTIIRNVDWKDEDNLYFATAKTAPTIAYTYNNLGDVYARRGDLPKALTEFKKALELDPYYADAYHNLALTYQQMGSFELAVDNYKKAVKNNPNLWQSYQNLAIIYYKNKNFEKANEYMKPAIALSPQDVSIYVNFGIIYLNQNKNKEAREMFLRALTLDPHNEMATQGLKKASE